MFLIGCINLNLSDSSALAFSFLFSNVNSGVYAWTSFAPFAKAIIILSAFVAASIASLALLAVEPLSFDHISALSAEVKFLSVSITPLISASAWSILALAFFFWVSRSNPFWSTIYWNSLFASLTAFSN